MAMLITSKIKLSGLHSYYDLISWGKKIIVSAQIDFALLERAFGAFALQQIMTFGQSHTNKQLRQTIRCNYNYCSSDSEFIITLAGMREFFWHYPPEYQWLPSINSDRKQCVYATLRIHLNTTIEEESGVLIRNTIQYGSSKTRWSVRTQLLLDLLPFVRPWTWNGLVERLVGHQTGVNRSFEKSPNH